MKRVALAFICLLAAMTVTAQANYREGQVIVKFRSKPNMARGNRGNGVSSGVDAALQLIGGTKAELLMPETGILPAKSKRAGSADTSGTDEGHAGLYVLQFDKSQSVEKTVETLKRLDDVEYAEPNYIRHAFGTAADFTAASLYNEQWYLQAINMPYLWDQPIVNDIRPVIAILDTGVDFNHPNLKSQSRYINFGFNGEDDDNNGYIDDGYGWNFINNNADLYDSNGHGTHCAGIAAGASDNGDGIVGANPDAKILGVKVLDEYGNGDDATIILGVNYAIAAGADILSMSFGEYDSSEALQDVLQNASQYAILIAAAGNEKNGIDVPSFPAAYPFVIGVEATDEQGELASFSNYDNDGRFTEGYNYDVCAPGVNMLSTYPAFGALRGVGYKRMDGTSMACPLVAGAVSRLMQCGKVTDFDSLRELLIKTSGLTVDMKAAYDATTETLNAETFQCNINGVMMTFHKSSATTAQVGDGVNPAISTETAGSISVPNDVHGLLVTSVADNAFSGCGQITEVFLPYYVNNIGIQAFSGCSQLGRLFLLSAEVPVCANDAFDDATFSSCHVEVPKDCADAYQADAVWGRFSTNLNAQLHTQGDNFSKYIGDYCFSFIVTSDRKRQVALDGVDPLNDLGREVEGIVEVPENIDGYQITSLESWCFSDREWLKQVVLPDGITEIFSIAFANSRNLETVNFPASLQSIGSLAFRDCIAFKNGHVPGSVKTIEGGAFENSGIEDLILDEGVERVDVDAFSHCLKLKKIHIPSTLISILESFGNLPNVESIEVAEGNHYYDSHDNCNAIISTKENYLLRGCKNTIIPEDVTHISGFWGTKGLTEIHLSKNVEFLGGDTFRACEDLTSVSVDKYNQRYYSLKGSNVIMDSRDNGSIEILCSNSVIPERASKINPYSLSAYRNSHITSVTIPTAMNIPSLAFGGCPITSVTSLAKRPMAIAGDAFYDYYYYLYSETDNRIEDAIYANATLYVPYGSKEIYEVTPGWSEFEHIVELPEVVRGDVNGDGTLDATDYTALIDHLLGKNVAGYNATAADADEDGRITARDLLSLKALLAGQSFVNNEQDYYSQLRIIYTKNLFPGETSEMTVQTGGDDNKAVFAHIRLPYGITFAECPIIFNEELGNDYVQEYIIDENSIFVVICPVLGFEVADDDYRSLSFTLNVDIAENAVLDFYIIPYYSLATCDGKVNENHGGDPYKLPEPPVPQLTFAPGQQWQTFYSVEVSCALEEGKGAKAYAVTDIIDQNVIATAIEGGVPERCMVLVGLDEMPTEEVSVGLTAKRVAEPERNYLQGQQIEATGYEPYSTYVLYNNEFVLNSGTSIPGGKGYLSAFQVKNSANARQRLKIVIGDETTSIRKVVETSDKNVEWYDLQGRRLNSQPSASGLYIRNRQKVVIK